MECDCGNYRAGRICCSECGEDAEDCDCETCEECGESEAKCSC